jgi:hypothetical protein
MDIPVKVAQWFAHLLSDHEGKPSLKRWILFAAVWNCIVIAVALLASKNPTLALDLTKTTLVTCAGAYGVTRFAEKK